MPIIHKVTFETVQEMIVGVVDIYSQYTPLDPLPGWWEKFQAWIDKAEVDGPETLVKKLNEIEKSGEKPDWWPEAEKAFRNSKKSRFVTLTTDIYNEDEDEPADDDEGDLEDEEGDEGDEGDEDEGELPEGEVETEPEEGEPPEEPEGGNGKPQKP